MTSPNDSAPVTGFTISPFTEHFINSLLPEIPDSGPTIYRWGGALTSTPITITYSFPTSGAAWAGSYSRDDEPNHGFQALNAAQQQAFRDALKTWSDVANLTFTEISETQSDVGDIRVAGSAAVTHSTAAAWAYYPWPNDPTSGDVWIDLAYAPNKTPTVGTYGFLALVHEIGHALGLSHSFEEEFSDSYFLTGKEDSTQYTVMSYTQYKVGSTYAAGPMLYDIAAIQYLYGANMTTRTGDDVYTFGKADLKAIWDAGGHDAFDVSNQTTAAKIDLQGGHFSSIGSGKNNVAIAFGAVIEDAIGTNMADTIVGNREANKLIGNGGNDMLDSGGPNNAISVDHWDDGKLDDLQGGAGNDIYYLGQGDKVTEGLNQGIDTIYVVADVDLVNDSAFSGQEIENVVLIPDYPNGMNAVGNGLNNIITGNEGENRLDGGAGNDTLSGGKGNDTYAIDNLKDKVIEAANGGTDTIEAAFDFNLSTTAQVENLTLTGGANLKGTGNIRVNTIIGNAGDNVLDGGQGIDFLFGGGGRDVYIVDNVGELDGAHVQGDGNDTAQSAVVAFTGALGTIPNYTYTGSKIWIFDVSGMGDVANTLTGGSGADRLTAGDGDDILDGGKGADVLNGGAGMDIYYLDNVKDTVVDSDSGNVLFSSRTVDLSKEFNGVFASVTLSAGTTAINITGDANANALTGNAGNNFLDGLGGADVLTGGKGNDIYIVYNQGEDITENPGEGTDTIKSNFGIDLTSGSFTGKANIENIIDLEPLTGLGVAFTGNALNNALTGGNGNDTLDGGTGDDTLTGGKGDDIYLIDSAKDKILETVTLAAGGGVDTVKSTISLSIATLGNIDNVTLLGAAAFNATGNALVNALTGNGNDNVLDGGKGIDTFDGGAGNDTYVLDNIAEVGNITEGGGIDTVKTSVSLTGPIANIENYVNSGSVSWTLDLSAATSVDHQITGGSGADKLTASNSSDTLDGGKGIDTLTGGDGSDIYIIDNAKDSIVEASNQGNDVVKSSVTYTLAANVEALILIGKTAINGTGNSDNNTITGGDGKNVIVGGGGDDSLTGGLSIDTFKYTTLADRGTGNETINDFVVGKGGDILDLHDLLISLGATAKNAVTASYLHFAGDGSSNTLVQIDADGGGDGYVTLVQLVGVDLDQSDTVNLKL